MSVAHPATTLPLIAKLEQQLEAEQPPNRTPLYHHADQARTALYQFCRRMEPVIRSAWYLNDPHETGDAYQPNMIEHGFIRLGAAFPDTPEIQDLVNTYYSLESDNRAAWNNLKALDEQRKIHQIKTQVKNALITALEQDVAA